MFKKKLGLGKESLLSSKDKKSLQKRLNEIEIFDKSCKLKQIGLSGTKIKIYYQEIEGS